MCADEDVDFSDFEFGEDLFDLFGFSETVEGCDGDGMSIKAFEEVLVVLFGEDGGGDEDGDLFSVEDGAHGGAHGDLGFSESDVPADQAFHGPVFVHVVEDGLDGFGLIGGFFVGEGVLECAKEGIAFGEGKPGPALAFGVKIDEVESEFFDVLPDFFFGAFPGAAAEFVEPCGLFGTGVFLDAFETLYGDVELSGFGVGDEEEVAFDAADFHGDEPLILSDAVVCVHDIVAGFEVPETRKGAVFFEFSG